MKRLRSAFVLAVAIVATWGLTVASAQTSIPNLSYVRDSAGQVFVVSAGQRYGIPIYPASDEQIAAIPFSEQWLVPNADGTAYANGPKPEWAVGAVAAPPVAAPPPPPPANTSVRLNGDRAQNTAPFDLPAGNFVATWRAQLRPGQSSCYTSATLYRVEGKRHVETIYNTTLSQRDGQTSAAGETRIYGVLAGAHYLDVSETGCSWSVEIKPM